MNKLPNAAVKSYEKFCQNLETVFDREFPKDFPQGVIVDCHDLKVERPAHDLECCRLWLRTYTVPIMATVSVSVYDPEELDDEDAEPVQVLVDRLPVGDVPAILEDGSFVVNGTSTVLVPTLDRSPGLLRERDPEMDTWEVKVVPDSGPWFSLVLIEGDPTIYARLNKSKLLPASILFSALGMDEEDMHELAKDVHGTKPLRLVKSRKGTRLGVFRGA